MPEVRERKKSDKIKDGSGAKKSPVKKDVRRQMTVKLKKEMIERQRNRDTGGSTDTAPAPEVQAAKQVEEKIYTTADHIREHTGDAVSKSIARYKRKQQKKKQRTEPPANEPPTVDTEPAPPPARERTSAKSPC